jgi:predicted dehydrogenase
MIALALLAASAVLAQEPPLRLAIAGLVHGHVQGFLNAAKNRKDVQIVGVADPDAALRKKYAAQFSLPATMFFADTREMIDRTKPEALAIFTSTYDHPAAVEAAAAKHIPAMMEKPLAVSMEHARRIEKSGIPIIVNYETTWYRSHGEIRRLMKAGDIRRMVAMDGHQGPKEINVQPEFFEWLTNPAKNGAGALFDFGCYGANLMTWLMDNQRPIAVTALTHTNKSRIYPKVDDESTILVQMTSGPSWPSRGSRSRQPEVPERARRDSGIVELAVQPEGLRGLRREGLRDRGWRRHAARSHAGASKRGNTNATRTSS